MLTNKELSTRLCELACKLEEANDSDHPDAFRVVREVTQELHVLANEKYEPGHQTWADLKAQVPSASKKKKFYDSRGQETPF